MLWLYDYFQWRGSDTFVIVFLFIPPWRWSHRWPKLGGWYLVIKLHKNTTVHLLRLVFRSLTNARI